MHRTTTVIVALLACLFIMRAHSAEEGNDETPHIQELRVALQEKHDDLPRVSVNTQQQYVSFMTIDLTQTVTKVEGKRYYAFRFTTPKEVGPLSWSFKVPKGCFGWYIVPAKGRMYGFTTFGRHTLPRDVSNLGKQGDVFVLQQLPAHNLQPNTDYIMWFGFEEDSDPKVTFSLNVLHSGSRYTDEDTFRMLYQEQSNKPDPGDGK